MTLQEAVEEIRIRRATQGLPPLPEGGFTTQPKKESSVVTYTHGYKYVNVGGRVVPVKRKGRR